MYQSFTGTASRRRNVNLSGRPSNPFGSVSQSSAVASAQQERQERARQRARLQASEKIQRAWRGHAAKRAVRQEWRQRWDQEAEALTGEDVSLRRLRRLMLFYDPEVDAERLQLYGRQQMAYGHDRSALGGSYWNGPWPAAYLKIVRACTAALNVHRDAGNPDVDSLLSISSYAARRTRLGTVDAVDYYTMIAGLGLSAPDALREAYVAPLENSGEAYSGLAALLATPQSDYKLQLLRSAFDRAGLARNLGTDLLLSASTSPRSRLWLLGNLIYLTSTPSGPSISLYPTIAPLLSSLASVVAFNDQPIDEESKAFDEGILSLYPSAELPALLLNKYLHTQLASLINETAIRNLLVRSKDSASSNAGSLDTSAKFLALYALTLLRCFPSRADNIRMWLYLGPVSSRPSNAISDIPATRFFHSAARTTRVFGSITRDSRSVLELIRPINSGLNGSSSERDAQALKDDWTLILVFLELYTFLLKIMDDEEFMQGSSSSSFGAPGTGRTASAIPLSSISELVSFLKNLGFVLYFNAADLHEESDKQAALLPGLTIDYLKGLVTGLLRALYDRDSRRDFLPKGSWLMTQRFDMTAFIPGVVAEEETRRELLEHGGADEEEEEEDVEEDDAGEDEFKDRYGIAAYTDAARRTAVLRTQASRANAQRKASRKRYLESVAPRLEILQNMPFSIPFAVRVEIFRAFVVLDQSKRRGGSTDPDVWRQNVLWQPPAPGGNVMGGRDVLARHHAKVRRKREFEDAFEQFYSLGDGLKEPIQITFEDEFGIPEAGIDGGGVTKEFLTSVVGQALATKPADDDPSPETETGNLFIENDLHLLHPSPTAIEDLKKRWRAMGFRDSSPEVRAEVRGLAQRYEFLGRIVGKCLYEGILIDVNFAGFFLKKWALTGGSNATSGESGYRASINDLRELDAGLYRGLMALKNAPAADVEDFGLTFTVDDLVGEEGEQEVISRELVKGGKDMPVTASNRLIYLNRMAWYRLQGQSETQTKYFLKGLGEMVQPNWLSMFNQLELQTLLAGSGAEIDIADLRAHTVYGGLYTPGTDGVDHPSISIFWKVMASLEDADRRKVLKFVTSTPRGPLLGFGHLSPRFSVRDSGNDEGRWPSASTCVNLLKLPVYKSERVLREKLLGAVRAGAGFDLS